MNRQILRLALPAIVSNITVPLLSMVDIAIVGHMQNVSCLAAISVGAMLFNVIYWVFGFLRMGTSGLVSQALGRQDSTAISRMIRRALTIGITIGVLFVILQWPLRTVMFWLLSVTPDALPFVTTYFNVCILGAPAVLAMTALLGIFIGLQNTRIPMLVAIVQNVVNVCLSVFFVFVCKMSIEGVALGTMLAQWIGFVLAFVALFKYYGEYVRQQGDFSLSMFRDEEAMRFFSINRDVFLRTLCLVSVNMFFTSAGSMQGDVILAVNTLLMTFFTMFSYIMDGFAFAGEALCGRFLGADDQPGMRSLHRHLLAWAFWLTGLFVLVYCLLGHRFVALLTDNQEVIVSAEPYIFWILVIPPAGVLAFIYDGLFIGMTRTREMLFSCLGGALCFFCVFLMLKPSLANQALWLALVLYLFVRGIFLMWRFKRRSPYTS